jgi:hypothetical protein
LSVLLQPVLILAFAPGTAQDMDMGSAAGAFEHAGDEDFVGPEDSAADRAGSLPVAVEAVDAASDVHEPVFAPVEGGEGRGFDQFAFVELGRTDRAGLGGAGEAFASGPDVFPPSVAVMAKGRSFYPYVEKESITEPEEGGGGDDKK